MDINTILNELFNFRTKKRRENINDLKEIYALLGFPCQNSKIIHVAGTNGKGSTVTFIENILFANGFRVGKFTSPHIQKFYERIIFNKKILYHQNDKKICSHIHKLSMLIYCLSVFYPMPFE